MKNKHLIMVTQAAIIAALYITINYLQEALLPTTTSMAVQFRLAELLTIFAFFTKSAIPGLTIGCLIANIINIGTLPLDMLFGTVASFLAAFLMYQLKNVKIFKLPVLGCLMPSIVNGVIIAAEIEIFFIEGSFNIVSFLTNAGLIALGEFVICFVLGLPFYKLVEKTLAKRLVN